ncbi:MAG: amidohydrolase [Acidimicrobiia bacterium]|nr:amidohydrolase [Acidimicrobiia bacterium]
MSPFLLTAAAVRDAAAVRGNALLIQDGRIAAIGEAARLRRPGLPERQVAGVVVPGLRDAHLHPVGHAAALHRVSLAGATSLREVAEAVSDAAAAQPPGTAVLALRLDDEALAEGRLPDRHLLDRAAPNRPVLLVRHCGHIAVASTAALEAAGFGPDTPDPPGGTIDRDAAGRPTGVLRETAVAPVASALQRYLPALSPADIAQAVGALAGVGLTGLGAIVSIDQGLWGGRGSELDLVLEAAADLPLPLKVLVIADTPAELQAAARRLEAAGPRVSFLGLKAFADGSLGGHTAALRRPYADRPGHHGTLRLDPAWARGMVRAAADLGGRAAIHAIGDAALSRVLDVFEEAIAGGVDPRELRVEHASIAPPEEVSRLAGLGVIACIQPAFLPSDSPWLAARLGPDRLPLTYNFRTLADAGVLLAGGSDCPVEPPHPLWGMAWGRDRAGFLPQEALTGEAALSLFTTGAAAAIGDSADLTAGAPATLTVLAEDPVEATPALLRQMGVVTTFVNGQEVLPPPGIAAWKD